QTTSRVLHFPATGRASSWERFMPATALRNICGPARYSWTNGGRAGMVHLNVEESDETARRSPTPAKAGACAVLSHYVLSGLPATLACAALDALAQVGDLLFAEGFRSIRVKTGGAVQDAVQGHKRQPPHFHIAAFQCLQQQRDSGAAALQEFAHDR